MRLSRAGFGLMQRNIKRLLRCGEWNAKSLLPGAGRGETSVHILNVPYALLFEPAVEGRFAFPCENRDAILPDRTAAEDAGKSRAGTSRQIESFGEEFIRNTLGQIDEWKRTGIGSAAEVRGGLLTSIEGGATGIARRLEEFHVHRDTDFDDVNGIARLAKLLDGASDGVRLDAGEFGSLFVHVVVIADDLEKKGNVSRSALGADAFNPGGFGAVDFRRAEGRVVEQNFDRVRAGLPQPRDRKALQGGGEAAGDQFVVAGSFVGEEQARGGMAGGGSGQADFGVEEDGACIRSELRAHVRFKSGEQSRRNRLWRFAGSGGKELAEGAALVERQGGDDAAFAGERREPLLLSRRKLHRLLPVAGRVAGANSAGIIEPDHRTTVKRRKMKNEILSGALAADFPLDSEKRQERKSRVPSGRNHDTRGTLDRGRDFLVRNNAGEIGEEHVELAIHQGRIGNHAG